MRAIPFALVTIMLAAGAAVPSAAQEFRAVGVNAAVLYDAPSAKANKLYILNRGYPVEVVVVVEGWVKVRDASGDLNWIDSKALTDRRTVMVKVPRAQVHRSADEAAPLVFQAQQHVILELVDVAGAWLRVKHQDGQTGYIRASEVWGV